MKSEEFRMALLCNAFFEIVAGGDTESANDQRRTTND